MYLKQLIILIIFLLEFIPDCSQNINAESDFYIRLNQVGFLPDDIKTALVISKVKLNSIDALIKNVKTNKIVFQTALKSLSNGYGNFQYNYLIDFTDLKQEGEYEILVNKVKSYTFKIGKDIYKDVTLSLLEFFKVQRCGYTNPLLHDVCHIADATSIIDGKNVINKNIDVTGGWHDAGDYIKFLNTTAFATYMLLFSYEFNPEKFSFDNNRNNLPDILEEAKVGLDWLLRCNYEGKKFVTQVQDLKDHESEWRLPENDKYGFDRPATLGIGKNLIGIYSATLALASRIWRDKFQYYEFADKCLNTARHFYSIRNNVPDVDSSGSGMYLDKEFKGKLALAAIELFITTKNKKYYEDAISYIDSASNNFWWSWGDINPIVHYKLSIYDKRYSELLKNNLEEFNRYKNSNTFGLGTVLNWGSNNTLLGITLQNILWKKLTGDSYYDTLACLQKDFILGRNPWGISFIYGFGKNYSQNFHHQISYFKKKLPGGFAAGPVPRKLLNDFKIQFENEDKYSQFQTNEIYYRDDRWDYITNEPTISANATAIFVFGNLMN
ncbi:glycoside hydrolase family 9 protein [Rosettibacter firmus]|uniref:glycoside hydrolase family 9 protein n=1 Tax=Rosettibacter firmus TaxID=3111522 RepID=UPI00336C2B63